MIGKNIKTLRHENELTQEALAARVGVVRSTLNSWENNFSSPDIPNIIKLKNILNCTYEELLEGK